jgi:hypothetical protein
MKKIKENYQLVLIGLFLILFVKQCGINRDIDRINKSIKETNKKMDSLATKKELEIEGLKISKRVLYDWNSIIRTTVRPDDRMNQYDQEIEKLQKNK